MKHLKAVITLFLTVAVCLPLVSCREETAPTDASGEQLSEAVLNIGCDALSGYFNPFYVSDDSDSDVCNVVGVKLFECERGGSIVLDGDSVEYRDQEYSYDGIAVCDITTEDDGGVVYDIKLREDVCFSDGHKLNADDVIFTLYVLADPA